TTTTTSHHHEDGIYEITCSAPVNIAVIKYWGKRDEALLLPTNSSLSLTLSQDHLQSKTTIRIITNANTDITPSNSSDRIWLNGREEAVSAKRLNNVLSQVRRLRSDMEAKDSNLPKLSHLPIHIASVNNFPTAAGLASSASGFACLTHALSNLFQLPISQSDISRLARVGSGSACRSLYGGFVAWDMGSLPNGHDSQARQVASEQHWPDMVALILVASDAKKDTGSTEGMQSTVETAPLLQQRIDSVVPGRMIAMEDAIHKRDFDSFAELTMRDSNQFHAVCLDTFPPIFYLTDVSRAVIALITAYNDAAAQLDATQGVPDVAEVLALCDAHFPAAQAVLADSTLAGDYYGRAAEVLVNEKPQADRLAAISEIIKKRGGLASRPLAPGSLTRIIYTKIGDGPRILASGGWGGDVSLLDSKGMPKVVAGMKRPSTAEH
ncbi:diphosphomevalonate decarboxylase, partial [Blyttiomyces sp. JEL0837]